ncbi:unnamed protein product [Effrenium voratum]|nr:unnamed protein product [Effrenium voratum]
MLRDMLTQRIPCDLALVRSPAEFAPLDHSVPRLRPGLYVGDYGHSMYGQFRTEVLLLDYVSLSPVQLRNECQDPQLFWRPFGEPPPEELRALAELEETITFMRVVKQCGDIHVPMGATTFVAVCSPDVSKMSAFGQAAPRRVLNRQTCCLESLSRSWRGFGTLATPGFGRPSWAAGWLAQFGDAATEQRLGFVWDRSQDAVVLRWIGLQDSCPFLQRSWLPEDVR